MNHNEIARKVDNLSFLQFMCNPSCKFAMPSLKLYCKIVFILSSYVGVNHEANILCFNNKTFKSLDLVWCYLFSNFYTGLCYGRFLSYFVTPIFSGLILKDNKISYNTRMKSNNLSCTVRYLRVYVITREKDVNKMINYRSIRNWN